jgi:hypothetical protein
MIGVIKSVATVRKIYGKNVKNYSKCSSVYDSSTKKFPDVQVTTDCQGLSLTRLALIYMYKILTTVHTYEEENPKDLRSHLNSKHRLFSIDFYAQRLNPAT